MLDDGFLKSMREAGEAAQGMGDGQTTAVEPCTLAQAKCQKPWSEALAETRSVMEMDDKRARNRKISALYGDTYLRNPEMKWAGAAAFASKQVGCGMDQVIALPVRDVLAEGNGAVFEELYPALRFYDRTKGTLTPEEVKACLAHVKGNDQKPLPAAIQQGLSQVMEGHANEGALTLLTHEQEVTLQRSVYDSWRFKTALDVNRMTGNAISPIDLAFSAKCTTADPSRSVQFSSSDGRLQNFKDRMPYAKKVADRFIELSEDAGSREQMLQELRAIEADGGVVPAPPFPGGLP